MEETLGNVGSNLDLAKYPGFLPQCLEELCILQTSNAGFFSFRVSETTACPWGWMGKHKWIWLLWDQWLSLKKVRKKTSSRKVPSSNPVSGRSHCVAETDLSLQLSCALGFCLCVWQIPAPNPSSGLRDVLSFRKTLEASNSLCLKESKQAPWSEICSAHTGCVKGHVLELLIQDLFGDQILHFLVFWKPAGAEKTFHWLYPLPKITQFLYVTQTPLYPH